MTGKIGNVGYATYSSYQSRPQKLEKQLEDQISQRLKNIRTRMTVTSSAIETNTEATSGPSTESTSGRLDISA
jgi:hypothetical protein